jgi:hypothetical protein
MFFSTIGAVLTNSSASISLPYSYVLLLHGNPLENNLINSTFKYNELGNIILSLNRSQTSKNFFVVLGLKNSDYWQILSENLGCQRLGISKFYTIFSISGSSSYAHIVIGINNDLSVLIYGSLLVPIIEIAFMSIYYVGVKRKRIN